VLVAFSCRGRSFCPSCEKNRKQRGLTRGSNALSSIVTLTQRYDKEREEGRWYILKAMDYVGGDAAKAFIAEKGPKDKEYSVKALAARVMAAR
jgi:hypothetical protein